MLWWCTLALALTPREPLPPAPTALPSVSAASATVGPARLVVKLRDGQRASAVPGTTLRPLVHHDVSALIARAEERSGRAQPDYGSLYEVVAAPGAMQGQASALAGHEAVEVAWAAPGAVPPPKPTPKPSPGGDRNGTPEESYLKLQRYHLADHGVGSRDAWKLGFSGKGVRISDVEYGVNVRHEELPTPKIAREKGVVAVNPFSDHHDHGTAVMGIAIAQPDRAGIRGIAYGAEGGIFPINTEQHGLRVADAILTACERSDVGDIVMLEMQTVAVDGYAPMEVDADVWMATRTCVDAGIVVVAAAGNGSQNLDGDGFDFWRQRGDSGAIIVGAGQGARGSRSAEDFSNHGRRVDVHGWGSEVFTLGYGDHEMTDGDPNRSYTAVFGGTSSATPMVAGVAAVVQEAAKSKLGRALSPAEMRTLLARTGRPHQGSKAIGPLPDTPAAIAGLRKVKGTPQPGKGKAGKGKSKSKSKSKSRKGATKVAKQQGTRQARPAAAPEEASWWELASGCGGSGAWLLLPVWGLGRARRRQ